MSAVGDEVRPIIIKRKKVIAGGHHGGAWKVAYADFVTAMMAFFLLMWLLGATTEKQRKAIADHFNPTITVNRNSGGGGNFFGGDSTFTEETLPHSGTGSTNPLPVPVQASAGSNGIDGDKDVSSESGDDPAEGKSEEELAADAAAEAEQETFEELSQLIQGGGGEALLEDTAARHVLTKLTDEGLVIEIFDLPGEPLYLPGTTTPNAIMMDVTDMLARVLDLVENEVAINGHTQSHPIVVRNDPAWDLSAARAMALRQNLELAGLEGKRTQRVTGFADHKPATRNPMATRNNRLEVIILRSDI